MEAYASIFVAQDRTPLRRAALVLRAGSRPIGRFTSSPNRGQTIGLFPGQKKWRLMPPFLLPRIGLEPTHLVGNRT